MANKLNISQNEVSKMESGSRKFVANNYIDFLLEEGFELNDFFDESIEGVRRKGKNKTGLHLESDSLHTKNLPKKNKPKKILLDHEFLLRTDEVGELVMFLNGDYKDLKKHPLFKLFFYKIEKEAVINYKEWLINELNQETFTKEELIKKLLTKSG